MLCNRFNNYGKNFIGIDGAAGDRFYRVSPGED